MVDMSDDWMNPKPSGWTLRPEPEDDSRTRYLILRERSVVTFGTGGVTEWHFWAQYDTAEERDEALAKIRQEHPVWHLKPQDETVWDRQRTMRGFTA